MTGGQLLHKGFSVAKDAWALISAVGVALYFGVTWVAHTHEVVNVEFPKHVLTEEEQLDKHDQLLNRLAALQERVIDDADAAQIAIEIKCEEVGNDMPKSYCVDVLKAKRLREMRDRRAER